MIVIEIRNHREVAHRESILARALGRFAPRLIRRQVEHRLAEELEIELASRGIEVHIRVHADEVATEAGTFLDGDST